MLTFNYGSPYFWDKVVLTKFISGCRMIWDLICGTSWSYKSRTEKVTAGRKSAILPNWCCLLFITVLSGYPWPLLKWLCTDSVFYINWSKVDFLLNKTEKPSCLQFFFISLIDRIQFVIIPWIQLMVVLMALLNQSGI